MNGISWFFLSIFHRALMLVCACMSGLICYAIAALGVIVLYDVWMCPVRSLVIVPTLFLFVGCFLLAYEYFLNVPVMPQAWNRFFVERLE